MNCDVFRWGLDTSCDIIKYELVWFAEDRKNTTECAVQKGAKALKSVSVERAGEGKKGGSYMGSTKRRNRSTGRTKKGASELLFQSTEHMCEQSEFWHWEHLGCWQSWSHLFPSQNSNFGFWALLMMIKKPPICALGFWQHCGAGGEDGAARSWDGPGWDPLKRALPPYPGAKDMACVPRN